MRMPHQHEPEEVALRHSAPDDDGLDGSVARFKARQGNQGEKGNRGFPLLYLIGALFVMLVVYQGCQDEQRPGPRRIYPAPKRW